MPNSAPSLSDDLTRFAAEVDRIAPGDYASTEDGVIELKTAMAGVMRMFAFEAQQLEQKLETSERLRLAAEGRVQALLTPDFANEAQLNIAIREGVAAGKVVDFRDVFFDEQDFNRGQRENDGDAA